MRQGCQRHHGRGQRADDENSWRAQALGSPTGQGQANRQRTKRDTSQANFSPTRGMRSTTKLPTSENNTEGVKAKISTRLMVCAEPSFAAPTTPAQFRRQSHRGATGSAQTRAARTAGRGARGESHVACYSGEGRAPGGAAQRHRAAWPYLTRAVRKPISMFLIRRLAWKATAAWTARRL